MFAFVRRRAFLIFLGFVLLAIFIWIAGPYFEFADYRPLEPERTRIILFVVIVACWALARLVRRLRAYRVSDQLVAAVVRQQAPEAPSAEAIQLRERFEEAVAALKGSRRGGHSLYELPWYIIIGAPGSGKTTALLNSGLKFPLEQRVGKGALRGVGGTRNCDWWFTDEAVFLDTAGRYTTQDSDQASDAAGWAEFLALLKKYRQRRPLNGIILTISAQDLMTQGERERETHVEAARRRLEEVHRELGVQLPVYVMVTKCDLVAGFSEYFDDLTQEGRAQVWGVTFPYEQTLSGEAAGRLPAEFDALMARLNAGVLARIDSDRDVRRRARIFGFPQQMAALRDALTQFVADVFASTRLDRRILLRGAYLTSGTQEGTPIDRLLGAIGRRYGLSSEAVIPPTGRGKAYFVERLLKGVLIGESGLAGVNRRLEMQKAAAQLGAYAALALVTVLGVVALSVSYGRNRGYVGDVDASLSNLPPLPANAATAPPEALLPRLDRLHEVVTTADRHRASVPLSMRWGLYQGGSLGNAARDAYVRELDGTLLPRVAARIEARLAEFAAEPEKLYEYLRAYAMLAEPRHLDKDHLLAVAKLEWGAADNASPDAAARLSAHFRNLLDYSPRLRRIGTNATVVAQACGTIRQASLPRIIYARLKRLFQEDRARVVRLDVAAGTGAERVIRRKSGTSLSEPVPSFFSRSVFQEVVTRHIPEVVKAFAVDDWVCPVGGGAAPSAARLAVDVVDLYEREYIAAWDGVLQDIELVPFADAASTANALAILSGPASPLRGLFGAIAEQTNLVVPPAPAEPQSGLAATARKTITERLPGAATSTLGGLFGTQAEAGTSRPPGALVTARFQRLHRMMEGEPEAPIDRLLGRIAQMQQHLEALGPRARLDLSSDPELRQIMRGLQQEADTLPPAVGGIVGPIGRRAEAGMVAGAAGELEARYRQEVQGECAQLLSGRYPFEPGSQIDLPLRDFVTVFGHGGLFDTFYQENLEPLVDRSRRPWSWRSGAVQASRGLLDRFERAQEVRDLFFRRGGELELRFEVTILEMSSSARRFILEIDGQPFEYRKPVRGVFASWPGQQGTASAATWYERYGGEPRLPFSGPWSWFRLLAVAQEQRESDTRSRYTFSYSGHLSRVAVEAASINNPFSNRNWQRFRCQM